jgi:hypothetical protein
MTESLKTVLVGQTPWDIVIRHYGDAQGMTKLLRDWLDENGECVLGRISTIEGEELPVRVEEVDLPKITKYFEAKGRDLNSY